MARYVDGFVLPVPKKNLGDYRKLARKSGKVWREHGALEYVECVADDVRPGKVTSFPQSVNLKRSEGVFLDRLQDPQAPRRGAGEGHGRPQAGRHDGSEEAALRRRSHVLGRLQHHRGTLIPRRADG